jgi:hypothetical protein
MRRGFNISISVQSADELDETKIEAEVQANGLLSVVESQQLLPGAVAAAKALIGTFPGGPFLVNFHGVDHTQEKGAESDISVTVATLFTVDELPDPVINEEAAAAPQATTITQAPAPAGVTGEAPEFTSADTAEFTAGEEASFEVTTSGLPVSLIIATTDPIPEGLTFVDNGDGTATIAGTPTELAVGTFNLALTTSNGVEPDATQDLVLTVAAAVAPVI